MQKSLSLTLKFRISNLRGVTRHVYQIYFPHSLSNIDDIPTFYPLDNFSKHSSSVTSTLLNLLGWCLNTHFIGDFGQPLQ